MTDAISKAIPQVVALTSQDPAAHTVMRGLEKVNGEYTGKEAVVVLVNEKIPFHECQYALPQTVSCGGEEVRVDVQECAPFAIQLLHFDPFSTILDGTPWALAQAVSDYQRCFTPTVPGGVQISPAGSNWVGTLGIPWTWDGRCGFLTNRHVAGLDNKPGHVMHQPTPSRGAIGTLVKSVELSRVAFNQLDVSLFDSQINGKHLIRREIYQLPQASSKVVDLQLGDWVTKSGRTTGTTRGRVVGLDAQTTVAYGAPHGNLRFSQQVVIEGERGDMSAGGDSGSSIWRESDGGWVALLFAGGGGKTLANPARLVQAAIGGQPFLS